MTELPEPQGDQLSPRATDAAGSRPGSLRQAADPGPADGPARLENPAA